MGMVSGRAAAGLVAAAGMWLAAWLPGEAGASTPPQAAVAASAPALSPVVLPRDHGSHPGFGVEWWYTTGRVTDRQGDGYFYFATAWSGAPGVVARMNVVDLRHDRIVASREYLTPTALEQRTTTIRAGSYVVSWRPDAREGVWSVAAPSTGGLPSLPPQAPAPSGALSLLLKPVQPYVRHGDRGVFRQGPSRSDYYSAPRLAVHGQLAAAGRRRAVHGVGWLDHQWGNFASTPDALRWNWFACQLDDGRDLMVQQFLTSTDTPSGVQGGTLVLRDGQVRHLQRFTIAADGPTIRPPGAAATYPQAWTLTVPGARLRVHLRSLARHQFVWMAFVPSFWEGAAAITAGPAGSCVVESSRELTVTGI